MAKNYQWKQETRIVAGGYPGEEYGVDGAVLNWVTTSATSGSTTATYYYRDSDHMNNANSSIVRVTITDSWTASIDNHNYLTISLTTVVNSIVRTNDTGGDVGTAPRDITLRREPGGPVVWATYRDPIRTTHTIATNIVLDRYTFTLAPGQSYYRGSIFYGNVVSGKPEVEPYYDAMWLGATFKNILPPDYVPGETWGGSSWLSHNRLGGTAEVRNGSSGWTQMRTIDGNGTTSGNPPYIFNGSNWANQREIGQQ